MMNTNDVAERFEVLAQQGRYEDIVRELFADDAISIEPAGSPFSSVEGKDNILVKGEDFRNRILEMHRSRTSQVLAAGEHFTCTMNIDVTLKGSGRYDIEEVAVYKVREGMIVSEQFFF